MKGSSRLASLVVALVVLLSAPRARAESFAVIDLRGAVAQTEDGIRAQAQLKKLLDRRQHELDGKQTALARLRGDIERQSRFLSREALTRRMEMWQKEMIGLQSVFVDYNKELEKKQAELTGPILARMVALITKLARQNGYDIVIDKQVVPYTRPDLDITDRIVQMYNAGETG
ncbi:MAG: OmpH family outer membrane protein [Polyangiaceae bacterium]|nr:OmpH family outer membrane protein [Polyangiaceae bacterium]